ncbi:hypothetical protein BWI96_18720 [Siphonobacter sp. SORGH_AS_0500]|uniref:HRDC domain-containing protein n=1 Tax=Siphonobacter sp. SORGH_AS_0500 TaxID=1864824 RepID=UPI000CCB209E|nr:HRDC domain-containing protein [Siphonobacter sp. SORGH_AS_0500]PKK35089.1 hypothetical protein BWI96_18720 [Siphonobacter sp. SORGH_AS_0500]
MEQLNPLELATEFIHFTNKNVFLTGKAGTGKTTFLHNLKKNLLKRMVVVAPTGVAAINAGGVTIHSFFQLPFTPYIPDGKNQRQTGFTKERINLIKSLDVLVIDEISMVRADVLDGIDEVLRKYKNRSLPFGGTQLVMIGDLHQLSPVISDEEWELLRPHYQTIYFFGSKALQKTHPVRIELTHIYRQSEPVFVELLNQVRENRLNRESLDLLNQRYIPDFKPADEEGYITLSTHNASAQKINRTKLDELQGSLKTFDAEIKDEFPNAYPTELKLGLKINAQVMFVKNDSSRDKLYFNGKIGKVTRIVDNIIYVKGKDDYAEIAVEPVEWTNVKYVLNEKTKEIEEQIIGTFTQYPLKLAWAITIHKSQGLTFEKAIIDANLSFAHGQVYVALSRCKSLEGMVLSSPISSRSVRTDGVVSAYSRQAEKDKPTAQQLLTEKISFQEKVIKELFTFNELIYAYQSLKALTTEIWFDAAVVQQMGQTMIEIQEVSEKFIRQLITLFSKKTNLPEEEPAVIERVQKASTYFFDKLETGLFLESQKLEVKTDNQSIKKTFHEALEKLQRLLFIKKKMLESGMGNLQINELLKIKANADIEFKGMIQLPKGKEAVKGYTHQALYYQLKEWRDNKAYEKDVMEFQILAHKSLTDITEQLPVTLEELGKIKGIGKAKVKEFGEEIITIIQEYCVKNEIVKETATAEKVNPKAEVLRYYRDGINTEAIATALSLEVETVEDYLIEYIGTGKLDIYDVFSRRNITLILEYVTETNQRSLKKIQKALGGTVTMAEIKGVLTHLEHTAA